MRSHDFLSFIKPLLPTLARAYLSFALRTTKWRFVGPQSAIAVLTQTPAPAPKDAGALVAFWHHNLLLLPALWRWARKRNNALTLNVLSSRNRDGRLISQTVAPWDIIGIEGSSNKGCKNKGGARALRGGVKALRSGALLAITPDGPRGPALEPQEGIFAFSRLSGRVSVPVGAACRTLRLGTWDKLRLPLPFGRGYLCYASPLGKSEIVTELGKQMSASDERASYFYEASALNPVDVIWSITGRALQPVLKRHVQKRLKLGKEELGRVQERFGIASALRPAGDVIWFHAASVGEARAILPFITVLLDHWPDITLVLTTATVTGAKTVASHRNAVAKPLAARLIHQYAPYDVTPWVASFLAHWRPLALLTTDSEVWPGWLRICTKRGVSVGVLNGRLSNKSYRRWRAIPFISHTIFSRLALVAARHVDDATHFRKLGAPHVIALGDLKAVAPPLEFNADTLQRLRAELYGRTIFVAASTHPGEEKLILEAVTRLKETMPSLLSIIIPRHPHRGADVARYSPAATPLSSSGARLKAGDAVWIVDTLGELGLFYQLADIVFIGHSLVAPGGGHNPYEALHSGAALATGPYISNFADAYANLGDTVTTVETVEALGNFISDRAKVTKRCLKTQDISGAQDAAFKTLCEKLLSQISAMTGR